MDLHGWAVFPDAGLVDHLPQTYVEVIMAPLIVVDFLRKITAVPVSRGQTFLLKSRKH